MTEKIIIDGVNVAGCEYLENGMCNAQRNCDGYTDIECKYDNDNCYYKQLQHLKQENAELRERLSGKTFFCENCEKLARENEKLKEELREIGERMSFLNADRCSDIMRYRSALEEIKNMLPKECFNNNQCNFCPHHNANLCTCEIAKKISEVLG